MTPADFWRGNSSLRDITPRGERFPEADLFSVLRSVCRGVVFEFGCGDGRLAPAFDKDKYYGYDINLHALKAAISANPEHEYVTEFKPADTFLAHTVLLHVPDDQIQAVIDKAKEYPRIVIGEIMGRKWRRDGNPPVFNREANEYAEMVGRTYTVVKVTYPRYKCDLDILVFE